VKQQSASVAVFVAELACAEEERESWIVGEIEVTVPHLLVAAGRAGFEVLFARRFGEPPEVAFLAVALAADVEEGVAEDLWPAPGYTAVVWPDDASVAADAEHIAVV